MKTVTFDLARAKNLPHQVATTDGRKGRIVEFNLNGRVMIAVIESATVPGEEYVQYYSQDGTYQDAQERENLNDLVCVLPDAHRLTHSQVRAEADRILPIMEKAQAMAKENGVTDGFVYLEQLIGKDDTDYCVAIGVRMAVEVMAEMFKGGFGGRRRQSDPLMDFLKDLRNA